MKKVFLALAAFAGLAFSASAQTPGEDNGFGLKINFGAPVGNYGCPEKESKLGFSTEYEFSGASFGISIDNRWYVWHNDRHGVAVNAHWLDITGMAGEVEKTTKRELGSLTKTETRKNDAMAAEVGFLGVGPMYTFYIGNEMAVDGYYNIVPTYQFFSIEGNDEDDDSNFGGMGVTHNIGAAFRWKFLQAGLEFRMGEIELEGLEDDYEDWSYDAGANSFKFFVGFKF